jgi:hypothetical protein
LAVLFACKELKVAVGDAARVSIRFPSNRSTIFIAPNNSIAHTTISLENFQLWHGRVILCFATQ